MRIDQRLQTIVLQKQVELRDRLVLVAVRVVQARFDTAEEVADAGALKILPQRQIAGRQGLLDVRRFDMTFGTISAPTTAVAQRNLAGVCIIEPETRHLQEVISGNDAIEAIEVAVRDRTLDGVAAAAIAAEDFDVLLVTLVGRIGKVGKEMRVLRKPEVVVQPGGEEMVGSLVLVPSDTRNGIVDMVRNLERNAADILRLDITERRRIAGPGCAGGGHSTPRVVVSCLNRE